MDSVGDLRVKPALTLRSRASLGTARFPITLYTARNVGHGTEELLFELDDGTIIS